MKQVEDSRTLEISLEQKRGPGRPAKPDALTGAERARRYRQAHKASTPPPVPAADPVTENQATVTKNEFDELVRIEAKRAFDLAAAHAEIRHLLAKIVELSNEVAELKKSKTRVGKVGR